RHDIEQIRIDAEDRDQRILLIDVAKDTKRHAAELVNPEQKEASIVGGQHVRAVNPPAVELQRLGIGRADHRAIPVDQSYSLDRGASINMKANSLQRSRVAIQRALLGEFIEGGGSEIHGDLGAPQRDVRKLLELPLLLPFDYRFRSKMPCGQK